MHCTSAHLEKEVEGPECENSKHEIIQGAPELTGHGLVWVYSQGGYLMPCHIEQSND